MSDAIMSLAHKRCQLLILISILWAATASATNGGSISGIVKDPDGNVVPSATVSVKELNTGLSYQAQTDGKGYYTLPVLPVGQYQMTVRVTGFGSYERKDITLDSNAALTLDVALSVGSFSETVSVTDESLHVETTNSQMGEVISGREMAAIPLNGRSFTDLLSMQPGVAPETTITATTVQDVGSTPLAPSGTLNPGTISVNGQREGSNVFLVNESKAEEDVNSGAAIIPNLDSIAEFRIVTNNFDAEYGEYSGGQVHLVTKSGTNTFHGNVFEFFRNTDLDARNYFSPTRGAFLHNQFGGTFGGPIRHDKAFFFVDYQGTTQTVGIDTGSISVPSNADRTGNLIDQAASLIGSVSGPYFANLLSQELGYNVASGEAYYTPGCTNSSQCVFPNAYIPQSAWSVPAQRLLHYIPAPNTPLGTFSTSAYDQQVRDDKGAARLDGNTRFGLLSAYYYLDNFNLNDPYPTSQSGASVPGFNALSTGRAQLVALGDTKILNATAVNELHLTFVRDYNDLGQPVGGRNVTLASQGFVNPDGTPSIVPLDPKGQSVEDIVFNSYSIGAAANELTQTNNSYGVTDTFTKILGAHSMKWGGAFYLDQINVNAIAQFNGNFVFSGTETGVDFADFLIGIPSQYNQSQLNPFYSRNTYLGLFGQDSWHVLPNLTLNYGLRWDLIEPWTEKYNQISTFAPGEQSVVFPGAPPGIVYPTDPGVPRTLAPIRKLNFSPRVGLAWAPQSDSNGFLRKLLGAPGTTSVRAGFGTFYTSIEALSVSVLGANPPYGTTYSSPAPPLFATPFVTASNGQNFGQPFPYQFARENSTSSNPDPNINWPQYVPISGIPGYDIHNRVPYTQEWMLSLQRQAGRNTILSASYTGTANHRQDVLIESNPGNPALCLSLNLPSEVAPGSATCQPGGESNVFVTASGQTINGTRGPLGPNFGSNALQAGIGKANYNALQLFARHSSERLVFFGAYTYGKSTDLSSNIGEEVNPFNPLLSHAISSYDVRHNFVLSDQYELPFDTFFHTNRLTRGWFVSGIARVATGFPVTLVNNGDNSLIGSNPNGVNNSSIDEPDYNGGPLHLNKNPRTNGNNYFDTADFSMNVLGTPGTAKRRFFYGPGTLNFDMALAKNVPLEGSKALYFRMEAFNVFNHASFSGPTSVDGNIGSSTFGNVIGAQPARIMQMAAKFAF